MGVLKNVARRFRLWIGQALMSLGRDASSSLIDAVNYSVNPDTAKAFRDGYRSVRGRSEQTATGILGDLDGSRQRERDARSRREESRRNAIANAISTRIAFDAARGVTTSQEEINELCETLQRTL